jgi:hypothetical protein
MGGQVGIHNLARVAVEREESRIGGGALQRGLLDLAQHQNRVMTAAFPGHGVQTKEDRADGVVPTPHQVETQLGQPLQGRGKRRPNDEFLERTNLKSHAGVT